MVSVFRVLPGEHGADYGLDVLDWSSRGSC